MSSASIEPKIGETSDSMATRAGAGNRNEADAGRRRAGMPSRDTATPTPGNDPAQPAARTTGAAAELIREMTQRAAEHGEEAVKLGIQAIAGAHAPLASAGIDQTQRLVDAAARVTSICHEAAQSAAEDLAAISGAFAAVVQGAQKVQQTCLELTSRSLSGLVDAPRSLARLEQPIGLAELQRDLILQSSGILFQLWTSVLSLSAETTQAALRPLQERARRQAG